MKITAYMPDLSGGGMQRMTLHLLQQFAAIGYKPSLVLDRWEGELRDKVPGGVNVRAFRAKNSRRAIACLFRYIQAEAPDIILSNVHRSNIAAAVASFLAKGHQPLVIGSIHNTLSAEMSLGWKYRMLPQMYRTLHRQFAGFVAVSRGVAEDFQSTTRMGLQRISLIYNPVIDVDFEARAAEPNPHPWFHSGEPVFVSAGRLVPQKDYQTLLRAFAQYLSGGHRGKLVILGSGPLMMPLQQLAQELNVLHDVHLPGFVPNPLPYIRDATAYVQTSRYEGFGVTLVEALGVGTPVISTDCPHGPADILQQGTYGHLVPVEDPGTLAAALALVLCTKWDRDVLRRRAKTYRAEHAARSYLSMFQERLSAPDVSLLSPGDAAQ